ncbi:MAG: BamA/TamA family outer membrane protein, partial [Chitinophagales bacterium]
ATLLQQGNAFDADVIGNEQVRLFREIQNHGYYHFSRDNIYFEADTSNTRNTANVYVKIKGNTIDEDMKVHYISNIYVRPDFYPEQDLLSGYHDTTAFQSLIFIDPGNTIRMDAVAKAIFILKDRPYSRKDYDYTLSRLSDLGVFKFISIRFEEKANHLLDCMIYLTPARKHAVTTEVEASNIEYNVGAAIKLTYKDKNVFRSANTFDVSLNAGTQIPVFNKDSLIFNVSGQLNFYMRRFVVPFNTGNFSRYFNPRTKISLQANYYQQTKIYILNNYSFTFGYEWKENALKRHVFNPFSVSYINSTILSDEFQQRLDDDPFLRQSFEDQLIAGLNYTYIYSNQGQNIRREFTFFRFSGEVAGTSLYLLNTAFKGNNVDTSGSYVLFGTTYANFVRAEGDLRHYFQFTQNRSLVLRGAAGIAINYWNSDVIPYIKQFYLGGTGSMRAWSVRSLGPGAYKDTSSFYDRAGDIKLEANTEYRFNIFGRLNGAVFLDAGNIWLRKTDPNKPGANFEFNRFLSEIALGTGVGFRFDFTYFVLRLDVATPLRDPSNPPGERWVIGNLTNGETNFVKDKLVFNLAIGYPF